ncbi:MAG: hypothetical protein DDT27_01488 [Dehalococcoidia bacterium]|nr:hypothetical protein [Chloroflexota bacterium]
MTFSPPAVEPAEAPISIRRRRTALENSGQALKSVVMKPVVVMMDMA